ncbi:hypothetical protein JW935_15860 [candidate division KSB1 bacterium]|nr:hypothetical protein [candidate division KSB1 bacterium]
MRSLIVALIFSASVTTVILEADAQIDHYCGQFLYYDGSRTSFSSLWSSWAGDKIPYSISLDEVNENSLRLSMLRIRAISRIDYITMTPKELSEKSYSVRKVKVTFRNGAILDSIFINLFSFYTSEGISPLTDGIIGVAFDSNTTAVPDEVPWPSRLLYKGTILYKNGRSSLFTSLWSGRFGDEIAYGQNPRDFNHTMTLPRISFKDLSRITFLKLTQTEAQILNALRNPVVRKVNVVFRDGTRLDNIIIDVTNTTWRSTYEKGSLEYEHIAMIVFD